MPQGKKVTLALKAAGKATIRFKPQYLSADDRRAEGNALRDDVPRQSHAGWKPPRHRRDPVELLQSTNVGRIAELVPIRFGRMARSPFAFFRGSAILMAADLASTPTSGLIVQACGDAHLMNFGGFATPERNLIFDLNDMDETLPAPWEWDVKRLAASMVIAAQDIGLSDADAAKAARSTVLSYREHMADYATSRAMDIWYDKIDVDRLLKQMPDKETRKRILSRIAQARKKQEPEHLFPKLAEYRGIMSFIKDQPPLIFHPSAELMPAVQKAYAKELARYRESLPEHIRVLFDRFKFCDLAMKAVGVGSVGTRCAITLFMAADRDPLFLQVKEARASVLEPYAQKSLYENHGQRVVQGQRLMQSASDMFLGWTKGPTGRHFYVRQLRDMKISAILEGWGLDMLRDYGKTCGWALARAHARSGDAARIAGYMGSGTVFDEAVGAFAVEYAEQNKRDYKAFVSAAREGKITIVSEDI